MADVKISELTALASASVDVAADVIAVVDTSVPQTKKIAVENLLAPIVINKASGVITNLGTVTTADINGGTIDGITSLTGGTGDLNWDSNTLVVDSSANSVGIGVAAPAEILHLKKTATDSNVILKYGNDARDWMLGVHGDDSDKFKLETHDKTDVVVVTSAGNVGIGISAPAYALDILNSTTPQLNISNVTTDNTVKVAQITCSHYDNEDKPMTMMEGRVDGTNNYVRLGGGRSEGTSMNIMEWYFGTGISHDGGDKKSSFDKDNVYFAQNVGIGVTPPVTALDVHSAGTEVVAVFGMADDGNAIVSTRVGEVQDRAGIYAFMVGSAAVDGIGSANTTAYIQSQVKNDGGALQGDLQFYTNAGDSLSTAKMLITPAGNVGIGHTTPQYGLTLSQGVSDSEKIGWEDGGNNKRGAIFVNSSNDRMEIMTGTSDTVRMSIFADGLVNINTTSQWNLQCQREDGSSQGMILFTNGSTNVGSITTTQAATYFNTSSDYRLKENEVAISDGITRLKQLKPYRFNFKVTPDTIVDGFFAHEVSSIVPEAIFGVKDAVDENGDIEAQGIDQSKLVPLLVSALQEAIDRIEALENA